MLKRLYWRWRYARILGYREKYPDRFVELFYRLASLTGKMQFRPTTYQQRVRYNIATKTNCLYQLLETLDKTTSLVKNQLPHTDRISTFHQQRQTRRLDRWLVDYNNIPYSESEAAQSIQQRVDKLASALFETSKNDDVLYAFYSYNLLYVLTDVMDVLDALSALELSVEPEDRLMGQ